MERRERLGAWVWLERMASKAEQVSRSFRRLSRRR